jgi:hypothetical protein
MGVYEFNYRPIADAGPNQVVTVGLNGVAYVKLDGSGSYDGDGHELSYLWSWVIDENDFNAAGPNTVIELPAGQYEITLVVSDGIDESEPDSCTITVVRPIRAELWMCPQTIVRHSRSKRILALICLPVGIKRGQVGSEPIMLFPGRVEAIWQFVFRHGRGKNKRTYVLASFDKRELMDAIPQDGWVRVRVVGHLKNGRVFHGGDRVRIKSPSLKQQLRLRPSR